MAALLKKRALAEYSQVIQLDAPPTKLKRLKLVRRQKSATTPPEFDISQTNSSQDVLNVLVNISENMPIDQEARKTMILKLTKHYHKETEAVVRVKLISLVSDLLIQNYTESSLDVPNTVEEFCLMLKTEQSHKVKSQLITSLYNLGSFQTKNKKLIQKLLVLAKLNLSDSSHQVQCCCLRMISELAPKDNPAGIFKLIGEFLHSQESRVRCCSLQAMVRLHDRGFCLDVNLYKEVCRSLQDDFEGARIVALNLVEIFSQLYPEHKVPIINSLEFNRLVDDAFSQICQAITDLSMKVRAQAAALLGSMVKVSPEFLEQTLDKKLMSNMRRKRSAHERQNESYQTGEWSSGKKWNDDAPKEEIHEDAVNLMNSGTCGAFVHGLEDEFLEVRSASLDSLCALALTSTAFARLSLDFLVDMFNDEIEDVRLKAIHCLVKVNSMTVLREDQVETMLSVLEDFSMDIREAVHRMLGSCNLATQQCLKLCISKLLENLKRYPMDKHSIWRCLQSLGKRHPELTLPLVTEILAIHPFFDTPEPEVEDPAYICKLILIFNAAINYPTFIPLFKEHTIRHYLYLRHSLSSYVPNLTFSGCSVDATVSTPPKSSNSVTFFRQVLERISSMKNSKSFVKQSVQETAINDLQKLAEIEPGLTAISHCTSTYIECQLLMSKVLENENNMTMVNMPLTNSVSIGSIVEELVKKTLCLTHLFGGLLPSEKAQMLQLHIKALALQLTVTVNTSNTSALSLCDNLLDQIENLQTFLNDNDIQPNTFTEAFFNELSKIEDLKPGIVARLLMPLLASHETEVICFQGETENRIKEVVAVIDEPTGESDNPLKFTSGLVLGINFDAQIQNIQNVKNIRVKIKYPDQQTRLILPRLSDFRPSEKKDCYRLLTSVLLSHSTWSEACFIELCLVYNVSENQCKKVKSSVTLDLCKTVKVCIAPKPVRRGM